MSAEGLLKTLREAAAKGDSKALAFLEIFAVGQAA